MTTEKKKKAPVISNDAMLAVAELAASSVRFNWSKDEYDRDQIQLYFATSGKEIIAPSNMWLLVNLLNEHEKMAQMIAHLERELESKGDALN